MDGISSTIHAVSLLAVGYRNPRVRSFNGETIDAIRAYQSISWQSK